MKLLFSIMLVLIVISSVRFSLADETNTAPTQISGQVNEEEDSVWEEVGEGFGIVTFCLLTIAALTGLLMKRNRKVLFPAHKIIAAMLFLSAIFHGLVMIIS
jgi:hypothetical protein